MLWKKQRFIVGLDWLINENNKLFLLEFNIHEEEGNDNTYTKPFHFFQVSLNKLLQHQLIGKFMPDYTKNKEEFSRFTDEKRRVVYKQGAGSRGVGVSVLERPKWEPDFLEEFIPPRVQVIDGKNYPYVIRDYQMITAKNNGFSWRRERVFRKQSKVALEDSKSSNDSLRLNTFNGARRTEATAEEVELTLERTDEVMRYIREQGIKCNWDPTKLYDSAIIGLYFGYRVPMLVSYFDCFSEVDKLLSEHSIGFAHFGITNGLLRAIRASEYGADMIALTDYHSTKWDMQRIRYRLRRGNNMNIEHICINDNSIVEVFPPRDNIIIDGELSPTQVAGRIIDNYQKRRGQIKTIKKIQ